MKNIIIQDNCLDLITLPNSAQAGFLQLNNLENGANVAEVFKLLEKSVETMQTASCDDCNYKSSRFATFVIPGESLKVLKKDELFTGYYNGTISESQLVTLVESLVKEILETKTSVNTAIILFEESVYSKVPKPLVKTALLKGAMVSSFIPFCSRNGSHISTRLIGLPSPCIVVKKLPVHTKSFLDLNPSYLEVYQRLQCC